MDISTFLSINSFSNRKINKKNQLAADDDKIQNIQKEREKNTQCYCVNCTIAVRQKKKNKTRSMEGRGKKIDKNIKNSV